MFHVKQKNNVNIRYVSQVLFYIYLRARDSGHKKEGYMTNVIKGAPEFSITYRHEWRGRESLQRVHELRRFGERGRLVAFAAAYARVAADMKGIHPSSVMSIWRGLRRDEIQAAVKIAENIVSVNFPPSRQADFIRAAASAVTM